MPENRMGHDKIIGDIHGNLRCLDSVLETLQANDRVFIVGDLVDKGKNSLEVITKVIKHKNQIFTVRGNHEELCLHTIMALETMAPKFPAIVNDLHELVDIFNLKLSELSPESANRKNIQCHLNNGGAWIIILFLKEICLNRIRVHQKNVDYSNDSDVFKIKIFIQSLPYIIKVVGKNPFHIVHADMPLNDTELLFRMILSGYLTSDEKDYALWARTPGMRSRVQISAKGRGPRSIPAFTGHNNIDKTQGRVFRVETNTFNLDIGATAKNCILMVNITTNTYEILGNKPHSLTEHMNRALNDISTELERRRNLTPFLCGLQAIVQSNKIRGDAEILKCAASFIDAWQKQRPTCIFSSTELVEYACSRGYLSEKQKNDLNIMLTSVFATNTNTNTIIHSYLETDRKLRVQKARAENLKKQQQRAEFERIMEESHHQIENTSIFSLMMP